MRKLEKYLCFNCHKPYYQHATRADIDTCEREHDEYLESLVEDEYDFDFVDSKDPQASTE
jgi:hypothetical protein